MKVKCIDNNGYVLLTIGKTYDVISYHDDHIIIRCYDYPYYCPTKCFKSLSEIRNEKIDKLLGI